MALKNDFTFQGINVVGGYIRVDQGRFVNRGDTKILEYIMTYEKARNSGKVMQTIHECPLSIDNGLETKGFNPVIQAYEHAKTLPEFAGAVGVDQEGSPGK